MTVIKQTELRSNIKKYFNDVSEGKVYTVPLKNNKDIVIISKQMYNRLLAYKEHFEAELGTEKKADTKPGVEIETVISESEDDWSAFLELATDPVDDITFCRYEVDYAESRELV